MLVLWWAFTMQGPRIIDEGSSGRDSRVKRRVDGAIPTIPQNS